MSPTQSDRSESQRTWHSRRALFEPAGLFTGTAEEGAQSTLSQDPIVSLSKGPSHLVPLNQVTRHSIRSSPSPMVPSFDQRVLAEYSLFAVVGIHCDRVEPTGVP
jgi:hypothetical protein